MVMRRDQIPAFIEEAIALGCDIRAIGWRHYNFGDHCLSDAAYEAARPHFRRIREIYGDRDHLRADIAAHLRMLGRFTEVEGDDEYRAVA